MTTTEEALDGAPDEAKVFLSYSRKDRERASGIADALRSRHFGVFKDTDDILPTEEWRDRLQQLIEEADTIVFLLSPNSATSEVCAWEVEYAHSLNKRIAPIVIEDIEAADIPPLLAQLNFIFCTPRDPFENAVDTLASALSTDIDWIREHTRLAGLAARWDRAGKPARLLLRGQDIADAEGWRDGRPKDAPTVTALQAAFIGESRRAATRRQRGWIGSSLAVAAGAVALAVFAYFQSVEADRQRGVAEANAVEADRQRDAAEESEARARATRDDAWLTQSAILTDWAHEASKAGDDMTAALLLLAGLPDESAANYRVDAARPLSPEAADALIASYFYAQEVAKLERPAAHGALRRTAEKVAFSPDGERIFTLYNSDAEGASVTVWRAEDGAYQNSFDYPAVAIDAIAIHPERNAFVALFRDGSPVLIDADTGDQVTRFESCAGVRLNIPSMQEIVFSQDGRFFASAGYTLCVWDANSGVLATSFATESVGVAIQGVAFLRDGSHVAFSEGRNVLVHVVADGRTLLLYPGIGTVTALANKQANRLIITDTGSGMLAPGQARPDDYVWPNTQLWDLTTVKKIAELNAREVLRNARFSEDGERIVAAQENRIRVWSSDTGEEISTRTELAVAEQYYAQDSVLLSTAQFMPGGRYVVSSDFQGVNKLWGEDGQAIDVFGQPPVTADFYPRLALGPTSGVVVEYTNDAPTTLWKAGAVRGLQPLGLHLENAVGAPVGKAVLLKLRAYFRQRSESKMQGGDWPGDAAPEEAVARGADGDRIARWTRGADEAVAMLDGEGREIARLDGHGSPILSVAFGPWTAGVATTTRDGVRLYAASSGEELWRVDVSDLTGLGYRYRTAIFSQDGMRLFVLGEDYVDVFDLVDRRKIASLMSEDAVWNESRPSDFYDQNAPAMFEVLKRNFNPRAWGPTKDDLAPRFWRLHSDLQTVVDAQKASATRCLTPRQLQTYHLGDAPPRWCVTGPGLEEEPDPENWRPLRPYHTETWRDWLIAYDRDPATPPPK